jgi:hypothetical protein
MSISRVGDAHGRPLGPRAQCRRPAALQLAGAQRDRGDVVPVDAHLNAAADQAGIQRVVVGVHPDMRIGWHPEHPTPIRVRRLAGQRAHRLALLAQQIDRAAPERAVHPAVGALIEPAIQLVLEVVVVDEGPPGLKARLKNPIRRSTRPLACRSAGSQNRHPTFSWPQNAANASVGRPAPACSAPSRSHISV